MFLDDNSLGTWNFENLIKDFCLLLLICFSFDHNKITKNDRILKLTCFLSNIFFSSAIYANSPAILFKGIKASIS